MRNLKRALSLTLASVMLLGMMVVGSSAAQGYDDVSKDDNVEAIEVLQAIEVMVGDERGFGPERPVNRAEMAVVMALLLNLDYNYYVSSCPFNDVYDWARGPVGACYANGIVSGRGDGVYDPGATVTAVEAASMLMRALGYFQYQNDYEGNFVLSTVKQGSKIRIFDGVGSSSSEPMTRNQVAQMVLNALRTGMVEPDGNTLNLATPDGNIYTGKVNYVNVTSNQAYASAISSVRASSMGSTNDSPIVELGERLYDGKLKLNEYTTDAFERPARYWEFDGKAIGTYVKKELLRAEYTTEVTGKQLYDLLTKDTIEDYVFTIAVDGETTQAVLNGNSHPDTFFFSTGNLIRTNTKGVGGTGNGVLTQVFVDPDEPARDARDGRGTVYISVINTYLAKATDDYDEKREEAEFEVYSLEDVDRSTSGVHLVKNTHKIATTDDAYTENLKVKNEEINVEDVKDGDIVLVHVAEGEIKEILDPEVIAETELNSFKNGDWVNNGTKYDYADSTSYDPEVLDQYVDDNMKETTYNLYLDEYGYLIGIDIVEATTNYVFLTGIDGNTSNLANKTAEGNVIHLDGTMETVTIKLGDSEYADGCAMSTTAHTCTRAGVDHELNSLMNTWCKYTTNKNGDYVLTEIANDAWSFTRDDAGQLYTVANKTDKAGQSHVSNVTRNVSGFTNYGTIDKKHVSTPGIDTTAVKMAYGNDDSVYIAVTTGLIRATRVSATIPGQNPAFIIDDVDSVTTGVQNASLKALTAYDVWNAASNKGDINNVTGDGTTVKQLDSIANGVYNLFDEDGAIIAAVVVGEDDGSTTNYAYVTSGSMKQESYDKDKEEWTWSREVIINGEFTDVTEISDGKHPDIESMVRGQWYEMKYKGDGTVKSATLIAWDEDRDNRADTVGTVGEFLAFGDGSAIELNSGKTSKFIGLVRKVEDAVEDEDTVVLATDLTGTNATASNGYISVPTAPNYLSIHPETRGVWAGTNVITTTGNTLWIENAIANQKDGFAVRNDAKIVVVQDTHTIRNGAIVATDVMDNKFEYSQTGKEALAKAVNDLMNNKKFSGFISAVFEGGVATSVIIWDQTPEDIDTGNDPTAPRSEITVDINASVARVNEALREYNTVIVEANGTGWWTPTNSGDRSVLIPNGKTLRIKGNFNAVEQNVDVNLVNGATQGALKVDGTYTMNFGVTNMVNYDIEANRLSIVRASSTGTYANPVQIASDVVVNTMDIQNSTAQGETQPEVKVLRGATVTVNGNVNVIPFDSGDTATAVDNTWIEIDGTMTVNGNAATIGTSVKVNSLNSLRALYATIAGKLILNSGRALITQATGGIYSKSPADVLVTPAAVTPTIKEVTVGMTYQKVAATATNENVGTPTEEKEAKDDFGKTSDETLSGDINNGIFGATSETKQASAVIGGKTVNGNLEALVAQATDGTTITLNENVTLTDELVIENDITLDLNGKIVSCVDDQKPITAEGKVTIKGGTITAKEETNGYDQAVNAAPGSDVTLENVTVNGTIFVGTSQKGNTTAAKLYVKGCTITTHGNGNSAIAMSGNDASTGVIVIEDTAIVAPTGKDNALYLPAKVNMQVIDSNITGDTAVGVKSGSLTVTGSTLKSTGDKATDKASSSNGISSDGSVIFIDSNTAYPGDIKITIEDSTLISDKSYIVQEISSDSTQSNLVSLDLKGCTLTASGEGMTKAFRLSTVGATKEITVDAATTFNGTPVTNNGFGITETVTVE